MEDRDFFDLLYSQWAKTTGAEDCYWMYEEYTRGYDTVYEVYAVDQQQEQHFIASFNADEDADFITAVHGCFGDLIRRLGDALDEADRLDEEKDRQEGRIAELEMQADTYEGQVVSYLERIKQMEDDERERESFIEGLMNENLTMEQWLDNGGPP